MKKKNKIICIILLLSLMLSLILPLTVSADTGTNVSVQNFDNTPIEKDMANMEEAAYPANDLGECSVIGFMEYCYSNNSAYSAYYGLYVYIYNPTEVPLIMTEGANKISLSNKFGTGGKRASSKEYSLTYLDSTDNYRFYKFKVTEPKEQLNIVKDYAAMWNGRRRYEIPSLSIHFANKTSADTFEMEKTYEFTGFSARCDDESSEKSTLECTYYGAQALHLNVYDTNYRFADKYDDFLDSISIQDDLQSVYFSIPKEYYEKFGNLTKITAEWYQYRTSPMFVTSDMEAYDALFAMRNKYINEYGQLTDENGKILNNATQSYWRVFWDAKAKSSGDSSGLWLTAFDKTYNAKCRDDIDDDGFWDGVFNDDVSNAFTLGDDWQSISKLDWIFPITGEINSLDDYRVSSEEVKNYMKNYTNTFRQQEKILGKYAADLFERYEGDGYKYNEFEITDAYEYIDKNDNQTFWESLWGIDSLTTGTYSPIVTISEDDVYLASDDFSEKYLVGKEDAKDVKTFAIESYKKGEIPVLLRFANTEYYASEAHFDYAEEDTFNFSDVDGYVAQEYVFLNFDILTLEYTSKDGFTKTIVDVVMDPIDIINGIDPPSSMGEDDEWWKKIISVILFVLLIVLIMNFIAPLKTILEFVIDGIATVFSAILSLITLPFDLIFNRKRK